MRPRGEMAECPPKQNTTAMEASHKDTYFTNYKPNKNHKEKAFKRLSGQPAQKARNSR